MHEWLSSRQIRNGYASSARTFYRASCPLFSYLSTHSEDAGCLPFLTITRIRLSTCRPGFSFQWIFYGRHILLVYCVISRTTHDFGEFCESRVCVCVCRSSQPLRKRSDQPTFNISRTSLVAILTYYRAGTACYKVRKKRATG